MDCSLEECSVDSSEPESENESSTSSELATENQAQDGYACGAVEYDESLEPVANEEEALQYRERLQVETEEEEKLQCRFSGEQPVQEWCKCSNCSLVCATKPEECWCCKDIEQCGERMFEVEKGGQCITNHPGFSLNCLEKWVLRTAAVGLKTRTKKSYSYVKANMNARENEFFRSVAYRQYVRLIYEYVGWSRRIPLPNCVYNKIRDAFPSEEYHGYEEEEAIVDSEEDN